MKVIKRDGRAVDFDKEKIVIAIEKANKEVKNDEQAKKKDINKIIKSIENIDKKRILVEDIQDIIEEKLMELGKFKLAKKYIVYRYTRTLVRKQNTTDKSIFGIIKNSDEFKSNTSSAVSQRNYIASEVSKDITKRFLLPEKINNAINDGIIFFNDSSYFINPIFKSSYINISDMLENKITINNEDLLEANSFLEACLNTVTILQNICQNQYGEVTINLNCLSKFVKISKNKKNYYYNKYYKNIIDSKDIKKIIDNEITNEINNGINILLNTSKLLASNGENFKIVYILDLNDLDPLKKVTAEIFEKLLTKKIALKNDYPKLIYILNEETKNENSNYYHLTKLALKVNNISFISQKILNDNYRNSYFILGDNTIIKSNKKGGKFNLGIVSLNLSQIAILSNKSEKELFKLLDERLDVCLECLMIRYYALKNNKANISKVHYIDGAISQLENDDLIDPILKKSSVLSLSYFGITELAILFSDEIAFKVIKYIRNILDKWKIEKGLDFVLYSLKDKEIEKNFLEIDKERFGIIKNITDKERYLENKNENDMYANLEYEKKLNQFSNGGSTSYIDISKVSDTKKLLDYLYKNILCTEIIDYDKIN